MKDIIIITIEVMLVIFLAIAVVMMDKSENYSVKNFYPRKPYPTFFIEERGLTNPVIYDIHIQQSTLFIKAIGDGGKIADDVVPLEIINNKIRTNN